jgi:hypothetical protein
MLVITAHFLQREQDASESPQNAFIGGKCAKPESRMTQIVSQVRIDDFAGATVSQGSADCSRLIAFELADFLGRATFMSFARPSSPSMRMIQ